MAKGTRGKTANSETTASTDLSEQLIKGALGLDRKTAGYPVRIGSSAQSLPAQNPGPGQGLPKIVSEEERKAAQFAEIQQATTEFEPLYQGDPTDIPPADLHELRARKYGEDYVVTTNGTNQKVWTAAAWGAIRGDAGGYLEAATIPKEVRALKAKK